MLIILIMLNIHKYLQFLRTFGTIKQFKMPDLGEKIKEATIMKWHVKIGDQIEEFQPVADVQTDKLFTQIPSNYTGKVHKIFHQESSICQVGDLFLEIEVPDEKSEGQLESPKQTQQQKNPEQLTTPTIIQHSPQKGIIMVGPAARILALQNKIEITSIVGTGKRGTITKADLLTAINKQKDEPKLQIKQIQSISPTSKSKFEVINMTEFQKGMQKSMTESNQIPHLYLEDEFNITQMVFLLILILRKDQFRESIKKKNNKSITFMTLFVKSFSLALRKFPILNSTYDVSQPFSFKTHDDHNVSIALDSPLGLVVPNIKRVQNLTLTQIQEEIFRLRDLGTQGRLSQNELFGGTITLSNIGTIGGTYTGYLSLLIILYKGPLILPPQICIVGIGRVLTVPRLVGSKMTPTKIINVSFGCDHRILDGATVTRFANKWKGYLEDPNQMVLDMK